MSDEAHTIPDHIAARVARLINEAEDMRKQGADSLKQIYSDLRDDLREMGWKGSTISTEVAAFKGAISEMRLDEATKDKREEKSERVDDYVSMLSRARAREASQSYAEAKGVEPRGFIASLSDDQKAAALAYRGDDTHGEITDTQEQPEEPASQFPSDAATVANMEPDDVDRSAERASSAVEVGATNSPERATRRLDDLGSVQDGLKMSTDGQPKTGLSTDCIERPIEARVTAGETAPIPHSAVTPPAADKTGAAPLPSSAAPVTAMLHDQRQKVPAA